MKNNFLLTEDMLWDYADGLLAADEKALVDAYLRQHPEQQPRLDAILLEKKALFDLPLDKPGAGFADKVMAAWAFEQARARAAKPVQQDWVLRGIALAFGLMMALPIVYWLIFGEAGGSVTPQFDMPMFLQKIDFRAILQSPALLYAFYLSLGLLSVRIFEKYLLQRGNFQV